MSVKEEHGPRSGRATRVAQAAFLRVDGAELRGFFALGAAFRAFGAFVGDDAGVFYAG